jgi:CO/xanthine dehydrogenase Mo-binding subunit
MPLDTSLVRKPFKVIGSRVTRPDGVDKVTGRAKYGADAFAPGQLTALVLRSPHAHAKIRKIDISAAEKLAGVKAVITAADLPDLTNGDRGMRDILENCMARKKALYDGHAVAAVAAVDAHTARAALKLIKVDYQILPHVTEVDEALKPTSPLLHDDIFTDGIEPKPTKPSNYCKYAEYGHGDVDAGFAEADVVISKSYKTEQTHQGYIEPHSCLANVGPDGTAELWVCTQGPFVYRNQCATLLGMEANKLRVTASEIGGGFGGKTHLWAEPLALALSRKANRPVKLTMSREEVFRCTGPTSSASMDIKIGVKKDGTVTAAFAELRYQNGAFPFTWAEMRSLSCAFGPHCGLCRGKHHGRMRQGHRHGPGGLPHHERRQGRHQVVLWPGLRSHRHRPHAASRQESRPLECTA